MIFCASLHGRLGARERHGIGQLHVDNRIAQVFGRKKGGRNFFKEERGSGINRQQYQDRQWREANDPPVGVDIAVRHTVEQSIERPHGASEQAGAFFNRLQHQAAQGGRKAQGYKSGERDGDGESQGKLLV